MCSGLPSHAVKHMLNNQHASTGDIQAEQTSFSCIADSPKRIPGIPNVRHTNEGKVANK